MIPHPVAPERRQDQKLVPPIPTPRAYKQDVAELSETPTDRYSRAARAFSPRVVGPMPVKRFIRRYFELPDAPPLHLESISFDSVQAEPHRKEEICTQLLPCLNRIVGPTNFRFRTTSDMTNGYHGTARGDKPDLILMHDEGESQPAQTGLEKADAERLGKGDVISVGSVQLFAEVNDSPEHDFFTELVGGGTTGPFLYSDGDDEDEDRGASEVEGEDSDEEHWNGETWDELGDWDGSVGGWNWRHIDDQSEEEDEDATESTHVIDNRTVTTFGQSASHAETLLTRQFRTCIFSLFVSGRLVRFLRWDHEGVVVSEAIDYKANPTPLTTFLLAFTSASHSRRGWDTSAQPSHDPTDEDLFHAKITEHVMQQLSMKRTDPDLESKVNEHYQENVITRLLIPSTGLEEPLQILVSRPCSTLHSPTGRLARLYWGVDVRKTTEESQVVFVKDVWRSDVEGVELEGDILRYLNEKGVVNIPPFIAHGDVKVEGSVQVTDTDQLVRKQWVAGLTSKECQNLGICSRVHYRLVTGKVGYPLDTFAGSMELLRGTYDAFQAVINAHDKANTLHRAVNLENIILYMDIDGTSRAGHLVNWDLSCKTNSPPISASKLPGTAAFRSFDPVRFKVYTHKLKDDLEAFIYIVLYCALRWLPVTSEHSFEWWSNKFFTAIPSADWSGSPNYKCRNALNRTFTKGLKSKGSTKVLEWLHTAMDLHYNKLPNPLWDDGKALGDMWREKLKGDIPDKDRQQDKARSIGFQDKQPLGATFAAQPPIRLLKNSQRSVHSPTSAKRPRQFRDDGADGSPSKRSKPNWRGNFSATLVVGVR